jgi:NADH-quinone oxidoreductase subunit J
MRSAEDEHWSASFRHWLLPAGLGFVTLGAAAAILLLDPQAGVQLRLGLATPRELGDFLFRKYWLAVEVISLLLFAALAGSYSLGKAGRKESKESRS